MPIRIACQCGKQMQVKDEHAGKSVRCPGCGQILRIPGGPAPQQPRPQSIQQPPMQPPGGQQPQMPQQYAQQQYPQPQFPQQQYPQPQVPHQQQYPQQQFPQQQAGYPPQQGYPGIPGQQPGMQVAGIFAPYRIQFTGTGGAYFGHMILHFFLLLITFFIYLPWYMCRRRNFMLQNTKLVDSRGMVYHLQFNGTGGELFVTFLVGYLLTAITFGIYGPWFMVSLHKFFVENTSGVTPDGRQINFHYNATGGQFFLTYFLGGILTALTMYIYMPWYICNITRFTWEHSLVTINGQPTLQFGFEGTGGQFFPTFLLVFLSFLCLCGIGFLILPIFQVMINKFLKEGVTIRTASGAYLKPTFEGEGMNFLGICYLGGILSSLTLMIYSFWDTINRERFWAEHLSFNYKN